MHASPIRGIQTQSYLEDSIDARAHEKVRSRKPCHSGGTEGAILTGDAFREWTRYTKESRRRREGRKREHERRRREKREFLQCLKEVAGGVALVLAIVVGFGAGLTFGACFFP